MFGKSLLDKYFCCWLAARIRAWIGWRYMRGTGGSATRMRWRAVRVKRNSPVSWRRARR